MRPSNSKYACRVTLPIKKDENRRFCGDYRPLNAQTCRDLFPMPLVEDVIDQLGKSTWFTALDLQSGFWQIQMAPEDMKKTALITKTGLYDWTVMPFGLKNAMSTFTRTMSEVFKEPGSRFLKVFVDDLNVHSENWGEHFQHLDGALQTQGSKFETQSKQMLFRCKDYYLSRSYGEQGRYPTRSRKSRSGVAFPNTKERPNRQIILRSDRLLPEIH